MTTRRPEANPQDESTEAPDAGRLEDARLVGEVLEGNNSAFDELVRKYERQALAVSYRLLNQSNDAREVVQDAFLRAYRALDTLENPQVFGSWLLRIVSNLSLNYRRSRARRPTVSLDDRGNGGEAGENQGDSLSDVLTGSDPMPEQAMMTGELKQRIQQALDELPEKQRTALTLFALEKMPQKEVAEILGCSVEAVKWHVFSARKKLKEKLSDMLESDDE